MDTATVYNFYQRKLFTDVTIVFSGEREECHRLILASASEYFEKLLDKDSPFKESSAGEVTLKDDESWALRAVLRYIYSFGYVETESHKTDWKFHLGVYQTARKYLIKNGLKGKALNALSSLLTGMTDMDHVVEAMRALRTDGEDILMFKAEELEKKHINALYEHPGFRALVEEDKDLMWKLLYRGKAAQEMAGFVEANWAICTCGWRRFREPGKDWAPCAKRICPITNSAPAKDSVRSMWLKRNANGEIDSPWW